MTKAAILDQMLLSRFSTEISVTNQLIQSPQTQNIQ